MVRIATLADKHAAEAEMPVEERWAARTLYEQLSETAARFPERPAVTFQLRSGPKDKAVTLNWAAFRAEVTRAANLFRRLGIGPADTVAYLLPNGVEAAMVLLAGATAGIVSPVNPLLAPEHVAGILRDTGAKVVVTLASFPKTDLAQKVAEAVALAPNVETVLEVDLARYLAPPLRWIVPLIRPKLRPAHRARVLDFAREMAAEDGALLGFAETGGDRVCAYFHTGGTTGLPKVAQHRASGILYNGWCGKYYIFTEADVLMCPLPLFHVFAAYPILMSCLMTGAQIVMPTPQGYRGEGVMDNFWKLIARHKVTFLITVPTAVAALMQRKVDADVSTLRLGDQRVGGDAGRAFPPVRGGDRGEGDGGLRHDGGDLPRLDQPARRRAADRQRRLSLSLHRRAHPALRAGRGDPEGMRGRRGGRDLRAEPRASARTSTPIRRAIAGSSPRTAICGPAISGASTPTATSGSPAGRRI